MARDKVFEVLVSIVWLNSIAALVVEVPTVVVTLGGPDLAVWRRLGLGWRCWTGLGSSSATLAILCMMMSLFLMIFKSPRFSNETYRLKKSLAMNALAIILSCLVPAIAAV